MSLPSQPWYRELTRYHWFVLVVAALGWLFDTMDQQLFTLARQPAMRELLTVDGVPPEPGVIRKAGGDATAVFLIGWAIGGIGFGVLGDRLGRAKTMMLTILVYSIFTGFSSFSVGVYDFMLWRFLTGLGVGGEFAVGVALVAEVMPDRARPFALGLLQALSAAGNISAALIGFGLGSLEETGAQGKVEVFGNLISTWRIMFVIGTLPALLAIVIRRKLKEPERWQATAAAGGKTVKLGSYAELFGDPRWRKRALVGLCLAFAGVVGLWGIGFFSPDLNRAVFRGNFEEDARREGRADVDRPFVVAVVRSPELLEGFRKQVQPSDLITPNGNGRDASVLYAAAMDLHVKGQAVSVASVLDYLDQTREGQASQTAAERARRRAFLTEAEAAPDPAAAAGQIAERSGQIGSRLTRWASITLLVQNIGAFFGIYAFSLVSHRIGRRPTFAIGFAIAAVSTALVFWFFDSVWHVFTLIPLMGFCQLSLFGGYAIYFPELFPTRLRSTGVSFCYNVGRLVAAVGPSALGVISTRLYGHLPEPLPWRYAGVTMCAIFLLGLLALPFAPETRGQPLPE